MQFNSYTHGYLWKYLQISVCIYIYIYIYRFISTVHVIVLSSEIPVTKNTPRIKLQFLTAIINKMIQETGFRGGPVVKNTPLSAGDTSSIPDLGRSHVQQSKYSHVPQLLSLFSRTWEPQLLSPYAAATEARVP